MNRCPECGAYAAKGAKVCIVCGAKLEDTEETTPLEGEFFDYLQGMMDSFAGKENELAHDNERWIAALSYLGPAFIYTYAKNRDSELIRYHANQACLLFIAWLAVGAVDKLPIIGGLLKKCARLGLSALAFTGAKNAVANKTEPVPFIGELGIQILK